MHDARDHDEHHDPHRSTDEESVELLEGYHKLSVVVERHQACDEDDHVEEEGHVHVDVDHAADHPAQPGAQVPLMIGVIVNPEGHGQEEDEVGEDEVEYGYGGDGCGAEPYDVHHQAQADDATEQNH